MRVLCPLAAQQAAKAAKAPRAVPVTRPRAAHAVSCEPWRGAATVCFHSPLVVHHAMPANHVECALRVQVRAAVMLTGRRGGGNAAPVKALG